MGADKGRSTRGTAFSVVASFAIGSAALLAYAGLWEWTAPGFYLLLVLGTYAALGLLVVFQALRAARMDDGARKVGALALVVGLAVTIFLGLRPKTGCLDFGPCRSGLFPQPVQLSLGMVLTTTSLFLDLRVHFVSLVGE